MGFAGLIVAAVGAVLAWFSYKSELLVIDGTNYTHYLFWAGVIVFVLGILSFFSRRRR